MNQAAAEARRAYKRKWAAEHRDQVRQYQERYWEKRAARDNAAAAPDQDSRRSQTADREDRCNG